MVAVEILRSDEFKAWLETLKEKDRLLIDARLLKIELHGHFGDTNLVDPPIAELKWRKGFRVYYVRTGANSIWVLFGGTKHGQNQDINKARKIFLCGYADSQSRPKKR